MLKSPHTNIVLMDLASLKICSMFSQKISKFNPGVMYIQPYVHQGVLYIQLYVHQGVLYIQLYVHQGVLYIQLYVHQGVLYIQLTTTFVWFFMVNSTVTHSRILQRRR